MTFYKYDTNGNYIGQTESEKRPSFSTDIKPQEGQIFNRKTQKWETPYTPSQTELDEIQKRQERKEILIEIEIKETEKVRPLGELLSNTVSDEDKTFAQNKLDQIEEDLKNLRQGL